MNKKIILILCSFLIFLIVRICFIDIIQISGKSMEPALSDKQLVFVNKWNKDFERFDIVVIKKNNNIYIKRIVGLPSETIEYIDDKLYVNGKIINENFEHEITENIKFQTGKDYELPNDSYIVMGDNRIDSIDSRGFGIVLKSEIIGKLFN